MNRKYLGILTAIVLLVVVIFLNNKEVQLSKQTDFVLTKISSEGYELSSTITFNNPNLLSATINNIHEEFIIDGKQVGAINNQLEQGISGRKESAFPVLIRIAANDIDTNLFGHSALDIVVQGKIEYRKFTGKGQIEVNEKATVKIIIP